MSFVSVLILLARVGAMWWPLCSSACKGWGHLVAPLRSWRLIFDVLEAAGVTFWKLLAHFGRLRLPVATFQAHLAPEAPENEKSSKNDSKMGALFGSLLAALDTLGSIREAPGAKMVPKVAQSWDLWIL